MTHREAALDDCGLLAEMNHQLIQDEGHRNPMSVAELAGRMRGWLADGGYRGVLFERGQLPVGYALFRTESDASVYLRQFFVARDYRRQGVGARMVDVLFQEVFPAGVRVTVDVLAHNDAGASFWAAAGFQRYSVCLERFNPPDHTDPPPHMVIEGDAGSPVLAAREHGAGYFKNIRW